MLRKLTRTFRRTAVILVAVGVVTLGAYAFSTTSLASSLSEERGGPPAMMMEMNTSASTSDIVLIDNASADSSTVTAETQAATTTERPQMPMGDFAGRSAGLTDWLTQIGRNAGIMLAISTVVAVIQTFLKRRKRSRKLTMAPA